MRLIPARSRTKSKRRNMKWPLAAFAILIAVTIVPAVGCQENGTLTGEPEIDFKSNPPCVSASSPCQLAFQPLAPAVARQLAEAKKLFEDKDFVGTQTKLEAILVAQPDSKIVLYDLSLTY